MGSYNYRGFYIGYSKDDQPPLSIKHMKPHIHKDYEIFYLLSGDITYYIEGHVYDMVPGDILLINNREVHKPIFKSAMPYERIIIYFDESYFGPLAMDYNMLYCFDNRKLGHLNKISWEHVKELNLDSNFRRILSLLASSVVEDKLMAKVNFMDLLLHFNKIFKIENERFSKGYAKDDKIDKVIQYINANLGNRLTLDIIEEKCYVNKYYLSHLFKEVTGMTVMEYIAHKRILFAKNLLRTGMPSTQVAQESGYNDYTNFYKSFKKYEGLSPSQFKKKKC